MAIVILPISFAWLAWVTSLLVVACVVAWIVVVREARGVTRRVLLALSLALVLTVPLRAVICASCTGCDPWWLEWFYICI